MPNITPDNFHFYLIVGLICLLFVRDEIMPFIKVGLGRLFGFEVDPAKEKPASQASMDRLSNYYNHDTTEILKSIDTNVQKVHSAVEKLEESIHELHQHHSEWEKYGIPIRERK